MYFGAWLEPLLMATYVPFRRRAEWEDFLMSPFTHRPLRLERHPSQGVAVGFTA